VRVPDEAGIGMAKVAVSYPNSKVGPVAPTTFEIPIKDPPPKK
jgi:hypothetical protein